MKHIKLFEQHASSSYRIEDVCQKGEKVIVYQQEDALFYGIVSIEDAARISATFKEEEAKLRAENDYGLLEVLRYHEFGPGTTYFTLDQNGDFRGYTGIPDPRNFAVIYYTDTYTGKEGDDENDLNAFAFTFKRDHITFFSRESVNLDNYQNVDSLIQIIKGE